MNVFGKPRAQWLGIVVAGSPNKIQGKTRESKETAEKIDTLIFAEYKSRDLKY